MIADKDKIVATDLVCIDHTVSKKAFALQKHTDLEMLITTPQPSIETLGSYYKSADYISHTDAKGSFLERLYQIAKSFALRKKVKQISRFASATGTLLDVGAGTGDFLVAAKKAGWQVSGVEPNTSARDLIKQKGITNTSADLQAYKNQKFDVITLWHVLEHLPDVEAQIAQLQEMLHPKGVLFIAVPNYKSYDARYYKHHWAAYDVPRHLWHFSQKSIQMLFGKQKLQLVKTVAMPLDAFYVSMLSEKYKSSKVNYIKAGLIGLYSNIKAKRSSEYSSLLYIFRKSI